MHRPLSAFGKHVDRRESLAMRILGSSGPMFKLVDLSLCGSFALPKSLLSVSTTRSSGRGASHLYARTARHPTTTKRQKNRRNADSIGEGWGRQTHRKAVISIHRMAVAMWLWAIPQTDSTRRKMLSSCTRPSRSPTQSSRAPGAAKAGKLVLVAAPGETVCIWEVEAERKSRWGSAAATNHSRGATAAP